MSVPPDLLLEMLRRMLRIRHFELAVEDMHAKGEIAGAAHSSIGQEGEIVGSCMALRSDDYMVGNHRSHGHPIAKGAALRPLMAELLGKATGVNRGNGGSMHLADFSVGSLGETSIVASGIPVAAGAALGSKLLGLDRVCLCFFGDGAANEGAFHEGLNLAGIWRLPVVYVCENNLYASSTLSATVTAVSDIAVRGTAYAMPGVVVDGQDSVAVHAEVSVAVERARAGDGPSLIEAKTMRYRNHALGLQRVVASDQPTEGGAEDPIEVHRVRLLESGLATERELEATDAEVRAEVADAVTFARESPYPDPGELYEHLYAAPSVR